MKTIEQKRTEICLDIKQISFSAQAGIFNVWDLCEQLIKENIEGDFAEAGVTAGANPIVMSHVAREYNQTQRKVRMFDSFCGHPFCLDYEHPDSKGHFGTRSTDPNEPLTGKLGRIPDVQNVKNYVNRFNGWEQIIEYHPGFFQESFPNLPDFKLALLRVDVNLIESHNLCITYLYPRIVSGGFFITDDYRHPTIHNLINELVEKEKVDKTKDFGIVVGETNIFYFRKP